MLRPSRSGRETVKQSKIEVKGLWNANTRSRFEEQVTVVDNRKYKEFGSDFQTVYKKCKQIH